MQGYIDPRTGFGTIEDRLRTIDYQRKSGFSKDEGRDTVGLDRNACKLWMGLVAEGGDLRGEGSNDLGPRFTCEGVQTCHQGVELYGITFGISG